MSTKTELPMTNDLQWSKPFHGYEYRRGIKSSWHASVLTYPAGDAEAWIYAPGELFGEPDFHQTFGSTDEAKEALDSAMPARAWNSRK